MKFPVKILSFQVVGEAFVILELEKPKHFTHQAGQHIQLFFPDAPGDMPIYLSLASPPHFSSLELCIGVRQPGVLERYLRIFKEGQTVEILPAAGQFVVPDKRDQHFVFVAGGSGVSPLRAMCHDILPDARSIHFIMGSRNLDEFPFYGELSTLDDKYEHFHFLPCVDMPATSLSGDVVSTFAEHFHRFAHDTQYFLCGPKPMIDAFEAKAVACGVKIESIHWERFPYSTP